MYEYMQRETFPIDQTINHEDWGEYNKKQQVATYRTKSHHGIHLNRPMEISKKDRHGKENPINREADVMTQEFDKFADKHPNSKKRHS